MARQWVFAVLSLISVFVSYLVVFYLLPVDLLNREPVLTFGLPLLVGPFVISIASYYYSTDLVSGVLIGITPVVAAVILLLIASQSQEGIAGDGPIWLILLIVLVLGVLASGIGSMIGAALKLISTS